MDFSFVRLRQSLCILDTSHYLISPEWRAIVVQTPAGFLEFARTHYLPITPIARRPVYRDQSLRITPDQGRAQNPRRQAPTETHRPADPAAAGS
jgi:hypothetical protein